MSQAAAAGVARFTCDGFPPTHSMLRPLPRHLSRHLGPVYPQIHDSDMVHVRARDVDALVPARTEALVIRCVMMARRGLTRGGRHRGGSRKEVTRHEPTHPSVQFLNVHVLKAAYDAMLSQVPVLIFVAALALVSSPPSPRGATLARCCPCLHEALLFPPPQTTVVMVFSLCLRTYSAAYSPQPAAVALAIVLTTNTIGGSIVSVIAWPMCVRTAAL